MKQHILEHWIKLAQEIETGLLHEYQNLIYSGDEDYDAVEKLHDAINSAGDIKIELLFLKQHYSDLNT